MHIWKTHKRVSRLVVLVSLGAGCSPAFAGDAENKAALENSIAWLEQQQNSDGSWGQDQALRYSSTTTVADLLHSSNKYTDAYYASLAWIENHSAGNVDALSRKIDVLYEHGNNIVPDLSRLNDAKLDAAQTGWGLSCVYTSSAIDSVLALTALVKAGDTVGQTSAVNYLLSSQLTDGGWSVTNAAVSDYWITANVVSGLTAIDNPPAEVTSAISNAVSYLQLTPISSDSLVLASVALALYRQAGPSALVDSYISELLLRQSPSGDWGDIYTTATVSRLLAAALQLDEPTLSSRVSVSDQALRENINDVLGKNPYDNLTQGEMLAITSLDLRGAGVGNLTGLEHATSLQTLYVDAGVDVAAIAGIEGLTLIVDDNGVTTTYVNHTLDSTKLATTETITETVDYSLDTTGLPFSAGAWQPVQLLHNTGESWDAGGARLALEDSGRATVLWRQYDNYVQDPYDPFAEPDLSSTIYARQYDPALGWQSPVVVGTGTTDEGNWGGKLEIDQQGNGVALWKTIDTVTYKQTAYVARYDASSGWQTPMMLSSGTDTVGAAEMAMDAGGNVMAMWYEYDSSTQTRTMYARRFDTAQGWEAPFVLGAGYFSSDSLPDIAMNPQGDATALWYEYDSTASEYTIHARNYVASSGWQVSSVLGVSSHLTSLGVGVDDVGNAHVIRHDWDWQSGDYSIYGYRYDHLVGWSGAELLYNTIRTSSSSDPIRFAVNGGGSAMVMWDEYDSVAKQSTAYTCRYDEGSGWQSPDVVAIARASALAVDDAGNAQAILWHYDYDTSLYSVYASDYDAATGWQTPVVIQEDSYGFWNTILKKNAEGDGMILGRGDSGGSALKAQRYLAGDVYYPVQTGDTWESIAVSLYSSADVADELQTALGNPTLQVGAVLENLPAVLTDTGTTIITVPPYYLVETTDSWDSISAFLYSTADVADELQTALGTSVLVVGDKLTGLPANLLDLVSIQ